MLLPQSFDPVNPSADEARRWLRSELAKTPYRQHDPLSERVTDWFLRLWNRVAEPVLGVGGGWSTLALIALAALVVVLVAWVLPKVRRERRIRSRADDVLEDPSLTIHDYRARATRALAQDRLDEATLDFFRAIARSASDRTLLEEAPGRTAHEISVALARPFPGQTGELAAAADTFDAIRYGGQHATRADAEGLQQLDRQLTRTTPALRPPVPAGAHR